MDGDPVLSKPPPPPYAGRQSASLLDPADLLEMAVLGVLVLALDIAMLVWVSKTGDDTHTPAAALVTWLVSFTTLLLIAGGRQAARQRPLWHVLLIGVVAAGVTALVVLVAGSLAASSDATCTNAHPCDTGYGIGAVALFMLTTPVFAVVALVGRAAGRLLV